MKKHSDILFFMFIYMTLGHLISVFNNVLYMLIVDLWTSVTPLVYHVDCDHSVNAATIIIIYYIHYQYFH